MTTSSPGGATSAGSARVTRTSIPDSLSRAPRHASAVVVSRPRRTWSGPTSVVSSPCGTRRTTSAGPRSSRGAAVSTPPSWPRSGPSTAGTRRPGLRGPSTGSYPGLDSPFYGGINTAPPHRRQAGGRSRSGEPLRGLRPGARGVHPLRDRRRLPGLAPSPIHHRRVRRAAGRRARGRRRHRDALDDRLSGCGAPRGAPASFYLVQDFEPMFYPAGTIYALAEESLPARALRDLQHREPGPHLPLVRRDGTALHPGGRRRRVPRAWPGATGAPRRPGHPLRLRAARPLAELLGARRCPPSTS